MAEIEVGGPLPLELQHGGADGTRFPGHNLSLLLRGAAGGGDGHPGIPSRIHSQGADQLHVLDLPGVWQKTGVPAAAGEGEHKEQHQQNKSFFHRCFLLFLGLRAAGRSLIWGMGRRSSTCSRGLRPVPTAKGVR